MDAINKTVGNSSNVNATALQYQRAVTPTIDGGAVKGKVLAYSSGTSATTTNVNNLSRGLGLPLGAGSINASSSRSTGRSHQSITGLTGTNKQIYSPRSNPSESSEPIYPATANTTGFKNLQQQSMQQQSIAQTISNHFLPARYDLVPLSDEMPPDGIIFAKIRNASSEQNNHLVVFRTPEERLRNPERLNLDRRHLEVCPLLEQEQRLRLLNYQNNSIRAIAHLENLPNLIFLDLYNNKISSLEGPVSCVKGLRVLMAGKNKISAISNLTCLKKLDVLDLHSNDIRVIEGLEGLTDLRVLNLAGNRISSVTGLSSLVSLTELNLRRNNIETVSDLHLLPALQRVFLSHNLISSVSSIQCLFEVSFLIELSLDGNPLSERDGAKYRSRMVAGMAGLRHLDLKRITEEERVAALQEIQELELLASSSSSISRRDEEEEQEEQALSNPMDSDNNNNPMINPDRGLIHETQRPVPVLIPDEEEGQVVPPPPLIQGVLASARLGQLPATPNLFQVEAVGMEKTLVVVGDCDWSGGAGGGMRRQLAGLTEICFLHVSGEALSSKLIALSPSSLSNLRVIRLFDDDFHSLKSLDFLIDLFGGSLEHLVIRDNPVNTCCSPSLLRSYLILGFPRLLSFNDDPILPYERQNAETRYGPIFRLRSLRTNTRVSEVSVEEEFFSISANTQSKAVQLQKKLHRDFSRDFDTVMKTIIKDTMNRLNY